jgi:hypothetical protein
MLQVKQRSHGILVMIEKQIGIELIVKLILMIN